MLTAAASHLSRIRMCQFHQIENVFQQLIRSITFNISEGNSVIMNPLPTHNYKKWFDTKQLIGLSRAGY